MITKVRRFGSPGFATGFMDKSKRPARRDYRLGPTKAMYPPIDADPNIRQGDLARRLAISEQRTGKIIDAMIRDRLFSRRPDPGGPPGPSPGSGRPRRRAAARGAPLSRPVRARAGPRARCRRRDHPAGARRDHRPLGRRHGGGPAARDLIGQDRRVTACRGRRGSAPHAPPAGRAARSGASRPAATGSADSDRAT